MTECAGFADALLDTFELSAIEELGSNPIEEDRDEGERSLLLAEYEVYGLPWSDMSWSYSMRV